MSRPHLDTSELRDALPASVAVQLSDAELRSALAQAYQLLGPEAEPARIQGAAWLLAHGEDERRAQIDHLLQAVSLRREFLQQAEDQLLGALRVVPELDDTARDVTMAESLEYLERAEALLGILTARAGGTVTATASELNDPPAFAIELENGEMRVTTFEDEDL